MGDDRHVSAFATLREDLATSLHALGSAWRNRNVRRALLGLTAFSITEWAAYIALMVYAFDQGGTARVGIVALLQQIPAAVIAPLGSVLGDRYRRERVLLAAEVTLAAASTLAAVALLLDAAPALVYLAGFSVGYVLTLIRPTHGALLPWIAHDPSALTSAYTASGLVESSCVLVGPVVATVLLATASGLDLSGPGLVYAGLALLLLLGAWQVAGIRVEGRPREEDATAEHPKIRHEVGAGFRYVGSDPRPRLLVSLLGIGAMTLGFLDSLIVVIAFELLETGQTGVGLLNAALGVGGIVGASIALVAGSRERLFPAFRAGAIVYGSGIAATAAVPMLAPVFLATSGGGGTLVDISGRTMLQRLIPDEKLTRAFGVLESAYMGFEGIGAFVGAALAIAIGPRWTLLIGASLLPIGGALTRRRLRAIDVGPRVPAEDLELLHRAPFLAPLPGPALERVARNCVPMVLEPGTVLIREGDVGDRFYVLADGELEVTKAGRVVDEHGPGGYVGEIALLQDVARTATVTARSRARVLALERDEFLRAVTGHEPARAAADAVAAERLARLRGVDEDD